MADTDHSLKTGPRGPILLAEHRAWARFEPVSKQREETT